MHFSDTQDICYKEKDKPIECIKASDIEFEEYVSRHKDNEKQLRGYIVTLINSCNDWE